jgi:crotonobetainyl-CoA:carnitine CoA-transferase CaiB-like acyl-CoA transferase
MYSMGEEGMPPMVCQFGLIDQATAIMTSHQILTALFMRERRGIGQEVHVSILGASTFLLYFNILISQMRGLEVPRHDRKSEHPMRNYYRCADDRWLMMTLTPPDRHWGPLCSALGHPELETDHRFDTNDKKIQNAEDLIKIMDRIFETRSCDDWLRIFSEHDLFACAVNRFADLPQDPQIIENGYLVDFEHPTLGKIMIPGYPVHFSRSLAETARAAPELGEHTEEVLSEIGGYSPEEISIFRKDGIV